MTLQQLLRHRTSDHPGADGRAQGSALAVAVSNAGGLGSLPGACWTRTAAQELATIRAQTTSRSTSTSSVTRRRPTPSATHWREALAPYFTESASTASAIRPGPAGARSTPSR